MANEKQLIDELFQTAVDAPRYQLANMAREDLQIILNYLNTVLGEEQAAEVVVTAIGTYIAADGKVSMEEHQFIQDVLQSDVSYDALFGSAILGNNKKIVETIDELIDCSPKDIKVAFVRLCVAFIACDGHIGPSEVDLCLRYLE